MGDEQGAATTRLGLGGGIKARRGLGLLIQALTEEQQKERVLLRGVGVWEGQAVNTCQSEVNDGPRRGISDVRVEGRGAREEEAVSKKRMENVVTV